MAGIMTPAVTGAMAAQLDRVNLSPARLLERITELEAQVHRLQDINRDLRRQVADTFDNAGVGARHASPSEVGSIPLRRLYEHRFAGQCAYSTLVRYCQSGYWRARQDAGRRWHVAADQPLALKVRGKHGT